jgi:flagellar P-ring protein precursor FlgI
MTMAVAVAQAINAAIGPGTARALDAVGVEIAAPPGGPERVALMSRIEQLDVAVAEPPARVIVNARTGTVVISGAVRIRAAAVSHGTLTVEVEENPTIVQPNPLSLGQTAEQQDSTINTEERGNPMAVVEGASLNAIVDAINRLGASPGDLVAILEALRQAGALRAELVII